MILIAPPPETRVAIDHHYTVRSLLTPTEARFHACLEHVTEQRCRIQIKPRLADIFQHERQDMAAFNRISSRHVDFLICRNDDWTPMLAIELDDDSHERADRKKRDMFVNNLFASTGIPLLRIHVREIDRIERLVEQLTEAWYRRCAALQIA